MSDLDALDLLNLRCKRCGRRVLSWTPGPGGGALCPSCDAKRARPGGRLQGMWPRMSLIAGGKPVALPMKKGERGR